MDPSSPVVCQVPDCATTEAEIQAELKTFVSLFCSICKKDRAGKLCGCAFPSSLTFRSGMLKKIHELLGIELPSSRRAIQVCFKHPDLLKQAREACVARREDHSRSFASGNNASSSDMSFSANRPKRGRPKTLTAPFAVPTPTREPSIDERKMTTIQFGSTLSVGDQSIVVGGEDRLASSEETIDDPSALGDEYMDHIQEAESGDSVAGTEDTDKTKSQQQKKMRFTLGGSDADEDYENADEEEEEDDSDVGGYNNVGGGGAKSFVDPDSTANNSDPDEPENEPDDSAVSLLQRQNAGKKILKIQYKNYEKTILRQEMHSLAGQSFLNDVSFVCRNGHTASANSLILGAMSPFLRQVLREVPPGSEKVVLVPDVPVAVMELFLGLVFNERGVRLLDRQKEGKVMQLAKLLRIDLLKKTRGRPPKNPRRPSVPAPNEGPEPQVIQTPDVIRPPSHDTSAPAATPVQLADITSPVKSSLIGTANSSPPAADAAPEKNIVPVESSGQPEVSDPGVSQDGQQESSVESHVDKGEEISKRKRQSKRGSSAAVETNPVPEEVDDVMPLAKKLRGRKSNKPKKIETPVEEEADSTAPLIGFAAKEASADDFVAMEVETQSSKEGTKKERKKRSGKGMAPVEPLEKQGDDSEQKKDCSDSTSTNVNGVSMEEEEYSSISRKKGKRSAAKTFGIPSDHVTSTVPGNVSPKTAIVKRPKNSEPNVKSAKPKRISSRFTAENATDIDNDNDKTPNTASETVPFNQQANSTEGISTIEKKKSPKKPRGRLAKEQETLTRLPDLEQEEAVTHAAAERKLPCLAEEVHMKERILATGCMVNVKRLSKEEIDKSLTHEIIGENVVVTADTGKHLSRHSDRIKSDSSAP